MVRKAAINLALPALRCGPFRFAAGALNFYAYIWNNPANFLDCWENRHDVGPVDTNLSWRKGRPITARSSDQKLGFFLSFDFLQFLDGIWASLVNVDWTKVPIIDRDLTAYDVVVTILGLYFAWKGIRLAKASLPKPINEEDDVASSLIIKVFGVPTEQEYVIFAPFSSADPEKNSDRKIVFPLKVTLENYSAASADDVEVWMKINSQIYMNDAIARTPAPIAATKGVVVASEKQGKDEIVTVLWKVGHIPPYTEIELVDHVVCSSPSQEVEWSTDATSADGVERTWRGTFSFNYILRVTATARDRKTANANTRLGFRMDFVGELANYLKSRIGDDGKVNKNDEGRKAYVTFSSFEKGDLHNQLIDGLKSSLKNKDAQYQAYIAELVPSRFKSENDVREYLKSGLDQEVLEARGPSIAIAQPSLISPLEHLRRTKAIE